MRVLRHILRLPRIPVAAYRIQVGLRAGAIGIEQPAMKLDAVLRRDDHRLLGLVEPIRGLDLFGRVESGSLVRDFALIPAGSEHRVLRLRIQRIREHEIRQPVSGAGYHGGRDSASHYYP